MKLIPQHDQMDCGPVCISMISAFYGKQYPLTYLRGKAFITREGVSLLGISEAAAKIGFETFSVKTNIEQLLDSQELMPCILHWNQNHFVVLSKISRSIFSKHFFSYCRSCTRKNKAYSR